MKKIFLSLIMLLGIGVSAFASKIVTDSIYSKTLNFTHKYNVYLPDGYDKGNQKYPVVYLFHGMYGGYSDWVKMGNMKLVADELIASGEACPMIIVMPNAGDWDIYKVQNGYFNIPGWNYEDFFFNEFMPEVESKYRIQSDKGHRSVMGLSMGGGGCVVYCQKHPDMFSSCYAMSAWLDTKQLNDEKADKGDMLYTLNRSVRQNSALDFVENADEATVNKLRSIKWFIDCGDEDSLLDQNVIFYQKMRAKKIKAEFRVRNSGHNWEYWHTALKLALPFASRSFAK
ncbi:MAG: esterase family protein [Bacteroidales bacterium]|jgi:enterochelin esterase-like enzyme|nr:esterase family protein [Bacteroidales bacterium]